MKDSYFPAYLAILSAILVLSPNSGYAENWADKLSIKGFMSAAYHETNESAFYEGKATTSGIDKKGSFQGTKMGINLTARINDRIMLASQLLARAEDEYALNLDWAFVGLNLAEPLTLRVGKIKYPVGLVNEYRDVGFSYPWIDAPESIYSTEAPNGPQATRTAFTGASFLWEKFIGNTNYSADLFGGEVNLTGSDVRQLKGLTLKADWDDKVLLQVSIYAGTMANATINTAMNGQEHRVSTFGVKVDWNNYIVYAEAADVKMGTLTAMKAKSNYITFGYRVGKWLPHITQQEFEQGQLDDDQKTTTLGLRYELAEDTAIKVELSKIKTNKGQGLFDSTPNKSSVSMFGFSIDVIF